MDAWNVRYDRPTEVTTSDGFDRAAGVAGVPSQAFMTPPPAHDRPASTPPPLLEAGQNFASHFFSCEGTPRCEIGDSLGDDVFCDEGLALRDELLRAAPTPDDRAYLLHIADEYAQADWERRYWGS